MNGDEQILYASGQCLFRECPDLAPEQVAYRASLPGTLTPTALRAAQRLPRGVDVFAFVLGYKDARDLAALGSKAG